MSKNLGNTELKAVQPVGGRGARREPTDGATAPEGSTSSNTDPSGTKVYRHGVDSLYLSSKGVLKIDYINFLEEKKKAAQSEDETVSCTAQLEIAGHIFEVKDKGGKGFAFIIEDNAFNISLNKSASNKRPTVYAKISSESLTLRGLISSVADVNAVVVELCHTFSEFIISRVDLCADFSTPFDFDTIRSNVLVTKCEDVATYEKKPMVTGISVGLGGDISSRLYNKTIETEKRPRLYLHDLWKASGWDGDTYVWRQEFQLKRAALVGMGVDTVADLTKMQASLWDYLVYDWLRVVIENPHDTHRDRWPSQPFWVALSEIFEGVELYPLAQRFKNDRAPEEGLVFRRFASDLASYMAIRGYSALLFMMSLAPSSQIQIVISLE